ncbi:hypothetical protein [Streptomyces violaceus]|uniref:Extensin n=1 Tax=Streptomyces violaceus TaxID=1936 RepID=A0ABY9U523_STRVL|nr:hypothetical protein [Streptomyces janthinus]WND17890.1 hypothetical protein RI060_11300 [Streptomyces janthinus]
MRTVQRAALPPPTPSANRTTAPGPTQPSATPRAPQLGLGAPITPQPATSPQQPAPPTTPRRPPLGAPVNTPPQPPTPPATSTPTSPLPVVQRFWKKPKTTTKNAPKNTTGALAAAAAATIANTLTTQTAPPPHPPPSPPQSPPPPYSESASAPASASASANQPPPPAYTEIPNGGFDPRELTDFQLDELVHRLIGRITRLIRTELRMDRERIGRLRDPRH